MPKMEQISNLDIIEIHEKMYQERVKRIQRRKGFSRSELVKRATRLATSA